MNACRPLTPPSPNQRFDSHSEKSIVPEMGRISKTTFEELPARFKRVALSLAETGEIEIEGLG